jgi:hypothetical protein
LSGFDANSGNVVILFNPRTDRWTDHFRFENGTVIGLTEIGRATVDCLTLNLPSRVAARQSLMSRGQF